MGATSGGVGSLAVDNGSDCHPDGRDRDGSCWLLGTYLPLHRSGLTDLV